ncbi:MAG: SDR family oxidoreductase [Candidatus Heimdallarchaeota archaeon]|nr:SDR family oxidoreductase [Candidatus Heimdallarchaeota archaeon]
MIAEDILKKYKDLVEGNYKTMLTGKVSLVTGGAGGIGSAIARKLANLGSIVYINDLKGASELAEDINSQYSQVRAIPIEADITKKTAVKAMFEQILEEKGGVDILINNAAIHGDPPTTFQAISYENFKKIISVDLDGAVYCTTTAIPQMIEKGWGKIMFTAAPLSSSGIPAPYLAGKSGFIGLTKYLADKLSRYNITTFAVVLRHVYTPMIKKVLVSRGFSPEEGKKALDKKSLTGRMATPEEIARMFAYFALPLADSLSGQAILADGGITYLV